MSIAYVNSANGTANPVTYSPGAGGHLLVIVTRTSPTGSAPPTLSDPNNTWHIAAQVQGVTGQWHCIYYAYNCSASAVSATFSSGSVFQWVIAEYSGVKTASDPFDQQNVQFNSASLSTIQAGLITPSENGELLIALTANDTANSRTFTIDSSFNIRNNAGGNPFLADLIQVALAAENPTWTDTVGAVANRVAAIASFKSASPPVSYAISGTAAPNATILVTGAATAIYTADGSGNYSANGLFAGSYTVTPMMVGYTFSPASSNQTISSANITGINFTPTVVPPNPNFNVWTPKGTIISGAGQVNTLLEGNSQLGLGAGNVFKAWYGIQSGGIGYAESLTALPGSWTQYSGALPGLSTYWYPKLYKNGSTYYLYVNPNGSTGGISAWTSSDGITFTEQNATALSPAGGWEGTEVVQLAVLDIIAGTWYGYYSGNGTPGPWYEGLATSTDGINWTKGGSNPVISFPTSNFSFQKVGGVYYGWSQSHSQNGTNPGVGQAAEWGGIYRFTATNPAGPWTLLPIPTHQASTPLDFTFGAMGVTAVQNQVEDPCMVELGGNAYLFYSNGYGTSSNFNIQMAVAYNATIASIVAGYEGCLNAPIAQSSVNLKTLATDFNSGTFGSSYTQLSSASGYASAARSGANIIGQTAGDICDCWWNGITWDPDQWAQAQAVVCTGSSIGVSLRQNVSGTPTAYRFYWTGTLTGNGNWYIDKVIGGIVENLATGTLYLNAGDVLTAAIVGSQLMLYWDSNTSTSYLIPRFRAGILIGCATDTSIPSGAAGFALNPISSTANASITNFAGGSFRQPASGASTGTFVQKNQTYNGSAASSPLTLAYSGNNVGGNFLCCFLYNAGTSSAPTATVTDTQGNTWVKLTSCNFDSNEAMEFWYALNCEAGANTVSVALSGGGGSTYNSARLIFEYSGIGALDTYYPASNPVPVGTTTTLPPLLPGGPDSLFIFADNTYNNGDAVTPGTGWSSRESFTAVAANQVNFLEQFVTSIGRYDPSLSMAAGSFALGAVAFSSLSFSVSGNTEEPFATVSYTGTSSGSVLSDINGNFLLPNLVNGSYTITPSLTGYTFSPTSASETVSGSNITGVNFTAVPLPASAGSSFGFGFKLGF